MKACPSLLRRLVAAAMIAFGTIQAHAQQSAQLHVSSTGTFKDWGWPADGPALDLTFDVAEELPAPPNFNGPLIGGQQLHILLDGTLAQVTGQNGAHFYVLSGDRTLPVAGLQGHEIQVTPNSRMGTADAYLLSARQTLSNSAMSGTVSFTYTSPTLIVGHYVLSFQSGVRAEGNFSATPDPQHPPDRVEPALRPMRGGLPRY